MAPTIRTARSDDADTIYRFILELAIYEREPDAVEATPESLRAQMQSERPPFECLILEDEGEPRGFALYFHNYSTWRGAHGVYLEDLYVPSEFRGRGYGTALLSALARVAVERGCARMEWQVLDWNEPSIAFYESLGTHIKRDWLPCRLDGEALAKLAAGAPAVD